MSVTAKCLVDAQYASLSQTTVYTCPASTHTILDKFTCTNSSGGSATVSINLVPSGSGVTASSLIVQTLSVSAGATTDVTSLQNQVLNAGDMISVVASVASSIVIRVSGRQVQ